MVVEGVIVSLGFLVAATFYTQVIQTLQIYGQTRQTPRKCQLLIKKSCMNSLVLSKSVFLVVMPREMLLRIVT